MPDQQKAKVDKAAVDKAFEVLKTYDWGTDRTTLNPIDDAVVATQGDKAARKDLEKRLVAVLESGSSRSPRSPWCLRAGALDTSSPWSRSPRELSGTGPSFAVRAFPSPRTRRMLERDSLG